MKMRSFALPLFFMLIVLTIPCDAIFEGTANANIFINLYKQRDDFGRLALWHEAAAECLNLISVPMNEILYKYYKNNGYEKSVARTEKEALEIQEQRQFHLKRAEDAWKKSKTPENVLKAEHGYHIIPTGFINLVSMPSFSGNNWNVQNNEKTMRKFFNWKQKQQRCVQHNMKKYQLLMGWKVIQKSETLI